MVEARPTSDLSVQRRDEEDARLVSGAADILAALAAGFGLATLIGLTSAAVGMAGAVIGAGLCALLARWLVNGRGYAASAIVLAIGFALNVAVLFAFLEIFVGFAVGAAMLWFWRSYRVPIAGALVLAAPVGFLFVSGADVFSFNLEETAAWRALVAGAILFAGAMAADVRDLTRTTRVSGIAFWLHIFAAPCLTHGLFSVLGVSPQAQTAIHAPVVLAIVAAFALIALAIDRRPLLASSIGYLVYALVALGKDLPLETQLVAVSLAIGLGILLMAALWSPLRRLILAALPTDLTRFLPQAGPLIPPEAPVDEEAASDGEPVRLVSGFNDIFVVMGSVPAYFGSWVLGGVIAFKSGLIPSQPSQMQMQQAALLCAMVPAVTTWAVAEFFVRRRRMALPAVVLSLLFNFVAWALAANLAIWAGEIAITDGTTFGEWKGIPLTVTAVACLTAAALNLLFGWRQRIPFAAAMIALSLLPLAFADVLASPDADWQDASLRLLGFGLATLGGAILLDRTDPRRVSQRSDIAFWLHMLAAAMIVPVLFVLLPAGPMLVVTASALLAGLALFALLADRRAVLIVGLPGYVSRLGIDGDGLPGGAFMVLLLCGAVLWAVLNWQRLRSRALAVFGMTARPAV